MYGRAYFKAEKMKRLLWQLPAVVGGTAVLTFCGVTTLQAAMNGPLQQYGATIQLARASASAAAVQARAASPAPTVPSTAGDVEAVALPPLAACADPLCGNPAAVVLQPAPAPTAPADAVPADDPGADEAAPGPGRGGGAGRDTAPGQNRDASGQPAGSNGKAQGDAGSNGKAQGNAGSNGKTGSKGNGNGNAGSNGKDQGNGNVAPARQLVRTLDQILGIPNPYGSQSQGSRGNGNGNNNGQGNGNNSGQGNGNNNGNGRGNQD